jgi:beta-mannanase
MVGASPAARAARLVTAAVGAYVDGAPWNPAAWPAFIELVGRPPAILMWYQGWGAEEEGRRFRPDLLDRAYELGALPMVTWEPWDYRRGRDQPEFALRNIIAGNFDPYIRAWAQASRAYGRLYLLRFAHEMNTQAYPWGCGVGGNRPQDYILAWRHVREIFAAEGATNVRWVWAPNVEFPGTCPLEELFPGDEWVDWVGLDGYNGGSALPWGGWLTFSEVFGPTYRRLAALSDRPMVVTETASAEAGGNKAAWVRSAFFSEIPLNFPRIRAVIWFHAVRETDWRVNSSARALAAFKEVLASAPEF